ncbi:helix-turn-helix domain-containing protein [Streptomyces sp. 5.8]|uniref:helix-turn-helix domain-containing protein n=1 Tax=Streptomyces sp. 5.8 TaxID=3406571 RepID=UPI003BB7C1A6
MFANIDALLEEEPQLPPPAERARLREAAGITQARLAVALKTSSQTVKNYQNGRSEPKEPRLSAYQRLLTGWAAKYPAHGAPADAPAPVAAPQPEVPETFTGPAAPAATESETAAPVQAATSRRQAAKKAAAPALDPRFPHG